MLTRKVNETRQNQENIGKQNQHYKGKHNDNNGKQN